MAKRKTPITVTLGKILIEYTCDAKAVSTEITIDNINSTESECELCGSHGHMSIDIPICSACGKYHTIEVKEW